jgi:predicted CoA-binding protein
MSSHEKQKVVVLGASDNPERYSHKAVRLLMQHGHQVVPVNPRLRSVDGIEVLPDLGQVDGSVDTLSVYVSPEISSGLTGQILELKPSRVIFNPGSENPEVRKSLEEKGIRTEEACTLVLLRTGQF